MRVTATDAITHLGGTRCDRRVWIKKNDAAEPKEPGDLEVALAKMGAEHEARHAASFPNIVDLGDVRPLAEQARLTLDEVAKRSDVIYQGALVTDHLFGGSSVEVVGLPDFIIPVDGGHVIRDAKLARSVEEKSKPGIVRQLQIYGWLFERITGRAPVALEVLSGQGTIINIPFSSADAVAELEELSRLASLPSEPFEVVGWSKCQGCDFTDHCWDRAVAAREPGTIPDVDVGMGVAFNDMGVLTFDQIPVNFDEAALADFERPRGRDRVQRVGPVAAARVLRNVEAHDQGTPIVFAEPQIPEHDYYVMFDLEGIPPDQTRPEIVYLWGMQAYPADGSDPADPIFALAGFGPNGDAEGWQAFLAGAKQLMDSFGDDVPFVHWAPYEQTKICNYIETYGDPDGIAGRVREKNLLDLLPVTRSSVALPLPSYSLKVIEGYLGYERKLAGYKGDKSIARYMEAVESNDQSHRDEIIRELCQYNGEDLEATWVVLDWLRGLR
jgi:predicted RecB family nuclease